MRKLFCIAAAILFIITSCTKIRSTDIGNGLIPPIDGVTTLDTFINVETDNYLDYMLSRVYKSDDQVIGVISNDPIFGKTHASSFFEMQPTIYPFTFPGRADSLKVDSVVLVLGYNGIFGDSTIPQTWNVVEVDQAFKYDSSYVPERDDISYKPTILGTKQVDVRGRATDSVFRNQIRIPLNMNGIKDRLTKTFVTQNAYVNDSIFRTKFKGFGVVPMQNVGNALIRINFADTNTKLAFYYSSGDTGIAKRDTNVTYFRFRYNADSTTSAHANIIKRTRVGSAVQTAIDNSGNDNHAFIQTSPGTYATVTIPGLKNFPNSIIHRAYLICDQDPEADAMASVMSPPRYLLLSAYDTAKKYKINIPNDYELSSNGPNIDVFGGYLFYKSVPPYDKVASYEFNLSRYVQGIVTRKDSSYVLRLSAPANDSIRYTTPYITTAPGTQSAITYYLTPNIANVIANGRVRLMGGDTNTNNKLRMRLRIIYSRL